MIILRLTEKFRGNILDRFSVRSVRHFAHTSGNEFDVGSGVRTSAYRRVRMSADRRVRTAVKGTEITLQGRGCGLCRRGVSLNDPLV